MAEDVERSGLFPSSDWIGNRLALAVRDAYKWFFKDIVYKTALVGALRKQLFMDIV